MSDYKPSKYQLDIIDFIEKKSGNLLVDAKAGSGKTSTLVLIADKIIEQGKNCIFLAFNKSIVEELRARITSPNCEIKTLHSLGLSFIRSYLYRKHSDKYELEIDTKDERVKDAVKELFIKYCKADFLFANSDKEGSDLDDFQYNVMADISNVVNFCRLYNVNYHDYRAVTEIAEKLCFHLKTYERDGLKNFPSIVSDIIDAIKYSFEHPETNIETGLPRYTISYTDMIYLPCFYNMFPPFSVKKYLDFVLCDECQDLSVLQQLFLKRLNTGSNRFIFVGDENQAIYRVCSVQILDQLKTYVEIFNYMNYLLTYAIDAQNKLLRWHKALYLKLIGIMIEQTLEKLHL